MATAVTPAVVPFSVTGIPYRQQIPNLFSTNRTYPPPRSASATTRPPAASSSKPLAAATATNNEETIYFDGGAHYGDLVVNLLLGFTLLWLPLSLAAVLRAFYLRYRFTNLRVTVISGLTGQDRSDFSYDSIKDVQIVPRFIGEWGDIVITLSDGTKVDLRSVPRFRDVASYTRAMAEKKNLAQNVSKPKGF